MKSSLKKIGKSSDGREMHYSAGVIVECNGKYIRSATVHYWYLYKASSQSEEIILNKEEETSIGWYTMEMGQAYVNNKKIFLLNGLPGQVSYLAEIKAMQPILLHGKLAEII